MTTNKIFNSDEDSEEILSILNWVQLKRRIIPKEGWLVITTHGLYFIQDSDSGKLKEETPSLSEAVLFPSVINRTTHSSYNLEDLMIDISKRGNESFLFRDILDMYPKNEFTLIVETQDGNNVKRHKFSNIEKVENEWPAHQETTYVETDWTELINLYSKSKRNH